MSKKRSKKIEEPIKKGSIKNEDNQQLEDNSDVDELQLEKEKFMLCTCFMGHGMKIKTLRPRQWLR